MLSADVRHDYVQTLIRHLDQADQGAMESIFKDLETQALDQLAKEGFQGSAAVLTRMIDLRYQGQSYELSLELAPEPVSDKTLAALAGDFHQEHRRTYGYAREGEGLEMVNLRLVALGKLPAAREDAVLAPMRGTPQPIGRREVVFERRKHDTAVYNRDTLGAGALVQGPAVVEQLDSTIVIPPGYQGLVEPLGNMIIQAGSGLKGGPK